MSPNVEIHTPEVGDLETLVELWSRLVRGQQAFGTRLEVEENESAVRNWLVQQLVLDGVRMATIDERPVGFVTYELELDRFSRVDTCGIVHNLFVDPSFRGSGIGTTLLERAERQLAEMGANRVRLEVMATNERACGFYEDRGYIPHRVRYHKLLQETDNDNSSESEG